VFPNGRGCFLIVVMISLSLLLGGTAEAFKMPKIKLPKIGKKDTLEQVLKGSAIVLLIRQFGGALNDFINTILLNHGAANRDATKVVPILTFGQGFEAGACQVSGPADAVARVQVVLAIAATFDKGHRFKLQALVPSASLNPLKLDRVFGVGVSAIIDYKL
jgi:hypothetical protein